MCPSLAIMIIVCLHQEHDNTSSSHVGNSVSSTSSTRSIAEHFDGHATVKGFLLGGKD